MLTFNGVGEYEGVIEVHIVFLYIINTYTSIPKLHLPNEIFKLIFLLVASLVRTSLRMDMVDMLSERKTASPFLKQKQIV